MHLDNPELRPDNIREIPDCHSAGRIRTNWPNSGHTSMPTCDPAMILQEAARTLDFAQPAAVILASILQLISDQEDPYGSSRGS